MLVLLVNPMLEIFQITTGSLLVDSQGYLLADTAGNGDAGNITINADLLLFRNGGQINTATSGR